MNNRNKEKGNRNKEKVNWSKEVAGSGKLIGRIIGRFFSYLLNILLTVFLILFITGIIVGTVFAVYIKNNINPELDMSLFSVSNTNQTTRIYYLDFATDEDRLNRNGVEVELEDQRLYASDNSLWVSYTKIPKNLVNAFVAIEDKRFWSHHGVDWKSTAYAIVNYFIPLGEKRGGSTITQQMIKNITGDEEYTPQRKVEEILRALNLEKKLDKTQIMELYLNNIYLSQHCYGVQAAAYTYFNKDVSELSLIECAAIAGITNSPTRFDPVQNPEQQALRRDLILKEMLDQGYITQSEFDEAYGKDLLLDYQGLAREATATTNSWYTDQVMTEVVEGLVEKYGYNELAAYNYLYTGGLRIITLQDPEIQQTLENIYANDSNFPRTNNAVQPQSSAVVIDPRNGDVMGLVGARGEKDANLLLNHATETTRSPGSSLKPLSVYAPALEYGIITYGSVFDDVPVTFNYLEDDVDRENPIAYPKNLPEVYNGLTTVQDAVTRSVNTVAMRVLQQLGTDRSFDFVKNKLQIDNFIESKALSNGQYLSDKAEAPLALGAMSYGVTTLDMTAGYQIFANGGVYHKPRTWLEVRDSEGNVILENKNDSYVVISEQTASIMTKMLENVVTNGTAKAITLKSKIDCAGKTGTTSSDVDRWFVGYTPYYVCGVWFGYDIPQELGTLSWSPSVVAWDIIMQKIHQEYLNDAANGVKPLKTFETASGIIECTYCKDSGKLMTDACYADPRGNRAEKGWFTIGTEPTEYCDCHVMVDYDKTTGAIAGADCPEANIKKVGLLNVKRSFPINVKVTDAQYTYVEVPEGTPMPEDETLPFYIGLYAEDTYPGYTDTGGKAVYNHFCFKHAEEAAKLAEEARLAEEAKAAEEAKKAEESKAAENAKKTADTQKNDTSTDTGKAAQNKKAA